MSTPIIPWMGGKRPAMIIENTALLLGSYALTGLDGMFGGMPMLLLSAGQAGATSPAPIALTIVQAMAECLAGVVYANAIKKGAPCIFGTWPFVSDLRTGAMSGGSPEQALLSAALPADPALPGTERRFLEDTASLAATARRQTKADLRRLMGISDDLATLNLERFRAFDPESTDGVQAAFAFAGDVYEGLKARELDAAGLALAQDHVRILSGLYGLLRPLDRIQPYRLEMGTRLKTRRGSSLYDFWGDRIAHQLNADADWVKLSEAQRAELTQAHHLTAPAVISLGTADQLQDALDDCTLDQWVDKTQALSSRFEAARHAAVQQLKPNVVHVALPTRTLNDALKPAFEGQDAVTPNPGALAKALADLHQNPAQRGGWTPPQRIVYVSCNPATLARDAGILVHRAGYRCVAAGVINMFAHTAHVESMAVFELA